MTTSELSLFLALPVISFGLGAAVGAWGLRQSWPAGTARLRAVLTCLVILFALFFSIEFRASFSKQGDVLAAVQSGATVGIVLACACIPLGPVPAFFGVQLAQAIARRSLPDDEVPDEQ